MRITRKVFHDLAIWMVGFGLLIGIVFPFFVILLGVPSEIALKKVFFAACLGAGAVAGIFNFGLARWTVGARLRILADSMNEVDNNLEKMTYSGNMSECTAENCSITIDSEDEIGESALAFNRLVESLSLSMKTQASIRAFSEMLTRQLEIEALAENILLQFLEHTSAAGGLILYESDGSLKLAASRGIKNPHLVAESDHIQAAVNRGQSQTIHIPEDVRVEGVVMEFRPKEVAILPIKRKGVNIGVAVLATGQTFDSDQYTLIELFMQGVGLALNNAIAHDSLQRLAALDPLTGVYNRRFGLKRLREEFSRSVRSAVPFGVMIFDLDHFKVVNDTYGHLAGDCVLKNICEIAKSTLREGDVLFRYGGEEFIAILPAASAKDIQDIAERLRNLVENNILPHNGQSIKVTLSIGGAAYPGNNAESEETLIQLADEALYKAKDGGRNKVVIAQHS